jgi:hypothetical protein
MTLSRWKVLACTLTVGVGGLAVFATDPLPTKPEPAKEPAALPNLTVKPATPPTGSDTPAPIIPVKGEDIELTIPVLPVPAKADETKKPAEPVFEPIAPPVAPPAILPVKGEADAKDAKKPETPKPTPPAPEIKPAVPETPKPANEPKIEVPKPQTPKPIETPKVEAPKAPPADLKVPEIAPPDLGPPVKAEVPPPPPVELTPEPMKKPEIVRTPSLATPEPPESVRVPLTPGKPTDTAKLKLTLRMGDGEPRFEIRNTVSTDLLLKVYGQKIEMQAPPDAKSSLAGVTAMGRVRFTAPGIEGTCDHLTILSGTGEVLLKGNIHLKTKHGKAWSEISADKMVYQIGTNGLTAPGTPRVTPAGYIPD